MEESNIETHNAILTECQTLREHKETEAADFRFLFSSLGNRSMTCHLDLATSHHSCPPVSLICLVFILL